MRMDRLRLVAAAMFAASLACAAATEAAAGILIVIDKPSQSMTVSVNGEVQRDASPGKPGVALHELVAARHVVIAGEGQNGEDEEKCPDEGGEDSYRSLLALRDEDESNCCDKGQKEKDRKNGQALAAAPSKIPLFSVCACSPGTSATGPERKLPTPQATGAWKKDHSRATADRVMITAGPAALLIHAAMRSTPARTPTTDPDHRTDCSSPPKSPCQ